MSRRERHSRAGVCLLRASVAACMALVALLTLCAPSVLARSTRARIASSIEFSHEPLIFGGIGALRAGDVRPVPQLVSDLWRDLDLAAADGAARRGGASALQASFRAHRFAPTLHAPVRAVLDISLRRGATPSNLAPVCAGPSNHNYDAVVRGATSSDFVATKTCFKSFGGETHVLMADGTTKPISEVEVGDMVIARDPETGEFGSREVTHLWIHDDDLVRLEIGGDVVRTTEDHPFWNQTDEQWQRADELDTGDLVLTADGQRVKVDALLGSGGRGLAYNLSVRGVHTYHVMFGANAVLVHNSGCFDPPGITSNRHGQLTNGNYTIDSAGMAPHQSGSLAGGKSQWAYGVNAEKATLDAAAYADEAGLWVGNKAKVPVVDGVVGALGKTGERTSWINVYRNKNGFVHGSPGNPG